MSVSIQLLLGLLLFLLGLRLSAFFSGAETGFYRVGWLRLNIESRAGNRAASRILWFARNPAHFVATTLVGNNVANYVTTLSIGFLAVALPFAHGDWVEIAGTLAMAPVVFLFGELVPKNVYYRAPLMLLLRDSRWFGLFYRAFLPATLPLIWIARLFERFAGENENRPDLVLGRNRLAQVLSQGHQEGLITDLQGRLVNSLLTKSVLSVADSMIPVDRVIGLDETATSAEALQHARQYGLRSIPLRRAGSDDDWNAYVRVVDLTLTSRPLPRLRREMPVLDSRMTRLEAMLTLRQAGRELGVVKDGERVLGLVSEHGLVQQLFRPAQSAVGQSRAAAN